MSTKPDRAGILARAKKTRDLMAKAAADGARFTMSVPARRGEDLDLLVCDFMDVTVPALVAEVIALEARAEAAEARAGKLEQALRDVADRGNCVSNPDDSASGTTCIEAEEQFEEWCAFCVTNRALSATAPQPEASAQPESVPHAEFIRNPIAVSAIAQERGSVVLADDAGKECARLAYVPAEAPPAPAAAECDALAEATKLVRDLDLSALRDGYTPKLEAQRVKAFDLLRIASAQMAALRAERDYWERQQAEAAEERDAALGELSSIDAVLARRPALDKPTRRENIAHTISTAANADFASATVTELAAENLGLRAERDAALSRVAEMEAAKLEVRPVVVAFATEMERALKANDHKNGWRSKTPLWLMTRLRSEVSELDREIRARKEKRPTQPGRPTREERIAGEAADVANFAMMIADVAGKWTAAQPKGGSKP